MKAGIFAIVCGLGLSAVGSAQDATTTPPPPGSVQTPNPSQGGWQGQHPGMGAGMGPGRGLQGTVTEVAADHYTIKTDSGDIYRVNFSVNTRIMKQPGQRPLPGQAAHRGTGPMAQPVQIKPEEIKAGDPVGVIGQVDPSTKSVGAIVVVLIDPERAKLMQEMRANFGKTWIQGKVTAISGTSVTLLGSLDNTSRTFVADESTSFRKRREPITLADIQVGDMMRVEGALKDGNFVAAKVNVMGMPPAAATVPRPAETQPQPPQK